MSNRELHPSEIAEISQTLSKCAVDGQVNPEIICAKVGISAGIFLAPQAPDSLWFAITKAAHSGRSKTAGFRCDAVIKLVDAVAQYLQGNEELNDLAYLLGKNERPAPPCVRLVVASPV